MNRLNLMIMIVLTLVVSIPATAAITHRYDFTDDPNDVVGGLESVLEEGAYVQDGSLILAGVDPITDPGPRLVLDGPGIAISGYTDGVTLESWFTMDATANWNRLFDFGSTSEGNLGEYYLFYSPSSGASDSRLVISDTTPGYDSEEMVGSATIAIETEIHVVCVYDPVAMTMSIYEDGVLANSEPVTKLLSDVSDTLAYLGSATYVTDPEFQGSINEFRIYNKPLSAGEVAFTNHFGPDDAKEIALRSMSPDDGDDEVNAGADVTLLWTPEPWVDGFATYNVYVGTDPNLADPNIADVSGYANVVNQTGVVGTSWNITAETLDYDQAHYWRVDTVEGVTEYQGVGMSFTTLPDAPYFIDPVPAVVVPDEDDNVSVTVIAGNTDTYAWYKEGNTPGSAGTTDTLTLTGVTEVEAGNYYCDISFEDGPATTSDPIKVVARLLLAHWPFEDTLVDDTGNGWNGTAMSTVTSAEKDPNFAPGFVGQALDLEGVESYVDIVDGLQDDVRSGLTWSVWAYPRTAANWARFLSFNNGAASDNLFFSRIGTEATVRFNVTQGVDGPAGTLDATDAIEQDVWQMLTVTMSPTGEALYKNGAQIATGSVLTPNVIARTNGWIGQSAWPDALYDGLLDEIRIYNHALTPVEVALLYTTTTPEVDYVCVPDAENPLDYDLNGDCRVNLLDVVDMAALWLECERIPTNSCSWID